MNLEFLFLLLFGCLSLSHQQVLSDVESGDLMIDLSANTFWCVNATAEIKRPKVRDWAEVIAANQITPANCQFVLSVAEDHSDSAESIFESFLFRKHCSKTFTGQWFSPMNSATSATVLIEALSRNSEEWHQISLREATQAGRHLRFTLSNPLGEPLDFRLHLNVVRPDYQSCYAAVTGTIISIPIGICLLIIAVLSFYHKICKRTYDFKSDNPWDK